MASRSIGSKQMKNIGCIGCHQIGQEATRTIPAQFGAFNSGEEAWMRRLQSGLAGAEMTKEAGSFGDWTDRLAKGELRKPRLVHIQLRPDPLAH